MCYIMKIRISTFKFYLMTQDKEKNTISGTNSILKHKIFHIPYTLVYLTSYD